METIETGRMPEPVSRKRGQIWHIRTEFHIGLGEDMEGNEILTALLPLFRKEATAIVAKVYGGATMIPHYGGWESPEGKFIMEQGVTIVAYGHSNQLRDVCQRLLALTNQRALVAATIGTKMEAMEVFRD